jgi:hypothetical protein
MVLIERSVGFYVTRPPSLSLCHQPGKGAVIMTGGLGAVTKDCVMAMKVLAVSNADRILADFDLPTNRRLMKVRNFEWRCCWSRSW